MTLVLGHPARLFEALRRAPRGWCGILVFHGVVEQVVDAEVQLNHVDVAAFEHVLDFVKERFDVVTLDEVAAALASGHEPPPDAIVLTFDDGYRNNLTIAEPMLRSRGMPFSVFVSTRPVEARDRLPTYRMRVAVRETLERELKVPATGAIFPLTTDVDRAVAVAELRTLLKALPEHDVRELTAALVALLPPERWSELDDRFESEALLTWAEVQRLAAAGVTIGSHCHDHCILHQQQSIDEIRHQLSTSKALIEERIGRMCRHFCYPNGTRNDISTAAVRLVEEAGYGTGLTNIAGTLSATSNPFFLPRLYVTPNVDETLSALLRLPFANRSFARIAREKLR